MRCASGVRAISAPPQVDCEVSIHYSQCEFK
jgi:hypothetical protein